MVQSIFVQEQEKMDLIQINFLIFYRVIYWNYLNTQKNPLHDRNRDKNAPIQLLILPPFTCLSCPSDCQRTLEHYNDK